MATGNVGSILSNDLTIEIGSNDLLQLLQFLQTYQGITNIEMKGSIIECNAHNDTNIAELNRNAFSKNISLTHLVARKTRLEEEFLKITGKPSKN